MKARVVKIWNKVKEVVEEVRLQWWLPENMEEIGVGSSRSMANEITREEEELDVYTEVRDYTNLLLMLLFFGLFACYGYAETTPSTNGVVPPRDLGDHPITIPEEPGSGDEEGSKTLEILKSVVYGGLMESMTSLSVVSSAAAADATTVNIVAMGLANLIGGLFIIGPNLRELRNEESRYKELLGQTNNFLLHATVAVLAFLIFGLIPPITYGFSFHHTDDKDLKLVVVATASLLCIAILAIGKAYIQKKPNSYIKTVLYYIGMAVMASGISYGAGELIKRLVEKFGWFDSSVAVTLSLPQVQSVNPAWGSY
ncbi:Membrane protein of ER body-like protein [Camellia lanceoleosa]|uniref:Membrane protein of ER body-like protein n=1 Tax=Camellia lanceoleosa TaxID=1840588 RepID=A0ACC0F2T5_9ERIC|nr:Membrane protein of ER body-like protein [Camellia lanceoleosa]